MSRGGVNEEKELITTHPTSRPGKRNVSMRLVLPVGPNRLRERSSPPHRRWFLNESLHLSGRPSVDPTVGRGTKRGKRWHLGGGGQFSCEGNRSTARYARFGIDFQPPLDGTARGPLRVRLHIYPSEGFFFVTPVPNSKCSAFVCVCV